MPAWVNAIEEQGTRDSVNQGVFWPKDIYDARHKDAPLNENDCAPYILHGKKILGIWRDDEHGRPRGTISRHKDLVNKGPEYDFRGIFLIADGQGRLRQHLNGLGRADHGLRDEG